MGDAALGVAVGVDQAETGVEAVGLAADAGLQLLQDRAAEAGDASVGGDHGASEVNIGGGQGVEALVDLVHGLAGHRLEPRGDGRGRQREGREVNANQGDRLQHVEILKPPCWADIQDDT